MVTVNMKNKAARDRVFDDLDMYKDFCVKMGYVFNERDLYKRNTAYGQFERSKRGDRVIDNWIEDANRFGRPITFG